MLPLLSTLASTTILPAPLSVTGEARANADWP